MTRKFFFISILLNFLFINFTGSADPINNKSGLTTNDDNSKNEVQKIIADFSAYAATIKPELRDEIIKYRKEIAKINQDKRNLYNRLSQEAQGYLAKEQNYKNSLQELEKNRIAIPPKNDNMQSSGK